MKKNKKRKNKANYKVYRSTIFLSAFFILALILNFFNLLAAYHFDGYAYYYLIHFLGPHQTLMFRIFEKIPFIGNYYTIVIFSIVVLLAFIYFVIPTKNNIKLKEKLVNAIIIICSFSIFVSYNSILNMNILLNIEKIDQLYMPEKVDNEYDIDDLIILNSYLKNKVISYTEKLPRDGSRVRFDKDITKESIKSLQSISNEYTFLKGKYINNIRDFTDIYKKYNNNGTVGFTMGYGISMDYSLDKISLITTATHELCHMKGLTRENETVFCQIIANTNSSDEVVQYAGYLEAYVRVSYALRQLEPKIGNDIADSVEKLCLTNNYNEICELRRKDINNYIHKSDTLELYTYQLKNYLTYQDEFMPFITKLVNDYNAKIYSNDESNISNVKYLINNESEESIKIVININENKFNKLYDDLQSYKNYFIAIVQSNSKEDKPEEKTYDQLYSMYLRPFNKNDKAIIYSSDYASSDYDYERVSRLLLEYYDRKY